MKRFLSMVTAAVMLLGLCACGGETAQASSDTASDSAPAAPEPVQEASPAPVQEASSAAESELVSIAEAEEPERYTYTLPLTDTEKTYTIFSMSAPPFLTMFLGDGQSYNTAKSTEYVAEKTGVRLEYREVDMFSFAEQFNIMAASGDYTDMIANVSTNYAGGTVKALEDDIILDLTDYVENSMPVYAQLIEEKGARKELTNDEGQFLAICSINNDVLINRGPLVRQDWLDQLGMELPETYDDWFALGQAALSRFDCDYAFYFDSKLNPGVSFSAGYDLPGFDISTSGSNYYLVDGQVNCAYTSDNLRDYLKMLHEWYNAGLISRDFFNLSQTDTRDAFTGGSCIACWDNADVLKEKNEDPQLSAQGFHIEGAPLTVKEPGQTLHFSPSDSTVVGTDSICISTQCENVDLLISFLDYMFTEEGALICNYGIEGESYTLDENGQPQWTEAMYADPSMTFMQASCTYLLNSIPSLDDVHANESMTYDDASIAAVERWSQGFDGAYDIPSSLTFTTSESETYASLIADIDTYANEYMLRCITGENDIGATWDSYVAKLDEMGLGRCIEIKQNCYDRYLSR